MLELVTPDLDHLPQYKAALSKGWSPHSERQSEVAKEQLAEIAVDTTTFVGLLTDIEAKGAPVILPDGSTVPRLPGYHKWIWDGDFCGSMGVRWKPGTHDLPPTCLGHIGYSIVPWKRRRGYATRALGLLLKEIRIPDLCYVEITTDPDNIASQKVILANGGVLVERFRKTPAHGGTEALRYRIELPADRA
ncbi:MAG: GNAT family N-acetyltransferase [Bdellovibrionales bacterium]